MPRSLSEERARLRAKAPELAAFIDALRETFDATVEYLDIEGEVYGTPMTGTPVQPYIEPKEKTPWSS